MDTRRIHHEVLSGGVRIITPYSIAWIAADDLLEYQQVLKESMFEYCTVNGIRLGAKGDE
jgi:hypothetical protein